MNYAPPRDPSLRSPSRYEQAGTREAQILALLTERRGEKLHASAVAKALGTRVENVRTALQRLHACRVIAKDHEIRSYQVGNAVCKHKAMLWYVPVQEESRA